jgi:hypothetical protein
MNDLEARHYYLGPASGWSRNKGGHVEHSEETAHAFSIRNSDNKDVGNVTRKFHEWTFRIFGRRDNAEILYHTREEAWVAAQLALGARS